MFNQFLVGKLNQSSMNENEIKEKIKELTKKKNQASVNQDYPYAALLRDQLTELHQQLQDKK